MTERPRYPTSHFIAGRIDGLTGDFNGLEFLFINREGQILHSTDIRFNDFAGTAQEWKPKKRMPSGNIFTLFSPHRRSVLILNFDFDNLDQIEVHSGQNQSYAYELGSQADFWFKEPWLVGFDSKTQKPKYKSGTKDLRVVALPIFRPI